jgi:hypothetical protein
MPVDGSRVMTVFSRARAAAGVATALTLVSMYMYPGGTMHDRLAGRYSLTKNFLSDLGMTVAYNGARNTAGAMLFLAALVILVAGFGHAAVAFAALYGRTPRARLFTRMALVAAALACASFIGVALTPEDRAMSLHVAFTFFAFRMFPLVAIFFALAAAHSGLPARRAVAAWMALALELLIYVAVLTWGPTVETPAGLSLQVVAQKLITVGAMAALVALTVEGDRMTTWSENGPVT